MATYIKITPLNAYASTNYAGYPPSNLIDGTDSAWLSLPNTSLAAQFAGVQFSDKKVVRKVVIKFSEYWSSELVIGYSSSQPSAQSGVTRLRTITFSSTPNDDLGVPIKVGVDLTFFLDAYPAASFLTVHPLTATTGPYVGIAEITAYEQSRDIIGDAPKAVGFGFGASTVTAGTGNLVSNAFDASMTSWWLSAQGSQSTQFIFLRPNEDVTGGYIRVRFNSTYGWGDNIRIGYCLSGVVSLATTVNLRTINTVPGSTKAYDDNGVLIAPDVDLVFEVPTFPKGAAIVLYPGSGRTAQSQLFTTTSEYVCLNNFEFYGLLAPVVPVDGANPIQPVPSPVVPYSADPTRWKHTTFTTVGDNAFTPDPDTTMLFVVLVGAGAGGRINQNLDGTPTENPTSLTGKPTNLFNENGDLIFSATGGGLTSTAANVDNLNIFSTDWVRRLDLSYVLSIDPSYSENSGAGAVLNIDGSIAGVPVPLQSDTGAGLTTLLDFTKIAGNAATGFLAVSSSQWARSNALGWQSTNTAHSSVGYVNFAAKNYLAGQQLIFTYGSSSESLYDQLRITINGVVVLLTSSDTSNATFTYTIPLDGAYTVQFSYTKDGSGSQGFDRVWVSSVTVPSAGYPQTRGGSTGRAFALTLLPAKYRFNIGTGGVGVPAGQIIPASAHGKGGAGGAGGGNGGNGLVIVYEYKGQNLFDPPAPTDKPYTYFDAPISTAFPSFYRTNYLGNNLTVPTAVKHALRPRTRNVIILMCGAGGPALSGSTGVDVSGTIYPTSHTFVKIGNNSYTAESGENSTRTGSSNNPFALAAGAVGNFVSTKSPIFSQSGIPSNYSPSSALSVVGNYGQGGQGNNTTSSSTNYYAGGSGALALICITPEELEGTDRILDIQVAQPGRAGNYPITIGTPGAVLIYETESVFPATITSLVEMVLRKDAIEKTRVSTDARLVLRKDTQPGAYVSGEAELILRKETEVNDLQVTHLNLAIVYNADDPLTAISTDAELVLTKSQLVGANVSTDAELMLRKDNVAASRISWCMENILMRSPLLPTRISNTPRLLLVAEIASVFFLRFGTLEYPIKNQLYRSLTARATSVPDGAYIQLEGIFAPGTTMYINDVNVGLSSPIKNNDRVYIIGGVQNYFQTFINTYTYYTTNGEITREVCGSWQIIQPDLSAAIGRDYATAANLTWLKTIHTVATSQLVPQRAIANTTYKSFVEMLVSKIQTTSVKLAPAVTKALAQLIELGTLVSKTNPQAHDLVPEFTKMNNVTNGIAVNWEQVQDHEVYVSTDWNKTSANVLFVPATWDRQIALHKKSSLTQIVSLAHDETGNLEIVVGNTKQQTTNIEADLTKAGHTDDTAFVGINTSAYFGESAVDAEIASGYHTYTLVAAEKDAGSSIGTDAGDVSAEVGSPGAEIIGLEIIKRVEDATEVLQEYEYLEKDRSITATADYASISYSHYARYFSVGSIAVSAYSVLLDAVPDRVVGGAAIIETEASSVEAGGSHNQPVTYQDQKAKYGEVEGMKPVKGDGHNEYYSAIGEIARYAMGFIFSATPIKAIANYGSFSTESERTSVNAAAVLSNNYIVTKQYVNMHTLTPYRVAEAVNGVGKASLYMGFDTRQAALDYTSSYSDVTIKTQFNGFAYNVAVDKSFVCEIYFNGPVGWLLQGG